MNLRIRAAVLLRRAAAWLHPDLEGWPDVRFVGEMRRVQAQPGDIFVFQTEQNLSVTTCERLKKDFEEKFSGMRAMVVAGGLKVGVVGAPQNTSPTPTGENES